MKTLARPLLMNMEWEGYMITQLLDPHCPLVDVLGLDLNSPTLSRWGDGPPL